MQSRTPERRFSSRRMMPRIEVIVTPNGFGYKCSVLSRKKKCTRSCAPWTACCPSTRGARVLQGPRGRRPVPHALHPGASEDRRQEVPHRPGVLAVQHGHRRPQLQARVWPRAPTTSRRSRHLAASRWPRSAHAQSRRSGLPGLFDSILIKPVGPSLNQVPELPPQAGRS